MFLTQRLACEVVAAVLGGRNLTDTLLATWRRETTLLPRQRSAVQDISYGTLRAYGRIRFILERLLSRPIHEPDLHALLATGIYQLRHSRAAPYTVVDHAVKVAGKLGSGRGKGLVNAVLRNYLRQQDELEAAAAADPVAAHDHPAWWVDTMRQAYPADWASLIAASNGRPPMSLRVNQRQCQRDDYLALLAAEGLAARAVSSVGIQLEQPVAVDRLPKFAEGWVSVQDIGAQWAAPLLDVQPGMRVLDACAAPGGKTCHLLELADVELTAVDVDAKRLDRVRGNLERLQLQAHLLEGDASQPQRWWDGQQFDRILADVPCSATGVVRRHPDIKWLRRPEDFANFATQQAAMLEALWGCLKPGGLLLYATCSVFPQENAQQLTAFLARHPEARRVPLPAPLPSHGQLLPNDDHDGFYYALLAK